MRLTKLLGTNLEVTSAIRAYVEERLIDGLKKFALHADADGTMLDVECGKTSHHHQKGDVFRCEAQLKLGKQLFRAEATTDDLYASIDKVRDELKGQLTAWESKARKNVRAGRAEGKKILKEDLGEQE